MKTVREALAGLMPCFVPLGDERVALVAALQRVLAEDVVAAGDLPPFDNSAMDGYAVRVSDVALDAALPLQGQARAGGPLPGALLPGHALRVFTGAPIPGGADAVIMQEQTESQEGTVRFTKLPRTGQHIRARGSDLRAGIVALRAGQVIRPGEIGLLAGLDVTHVRVYRAPKVAILATGDELREPGTPNVPGSIPNSNAYALAALLSELGAVPWLLPPARDQLDELTERLTTALTADVVLCTGGVSVGDYDFVAEAFRRAGVTVGFWKVAIKPGKPILFGTAGRVPVVGLPGNPVSAMVTFEVFVKPGLRKMLGHSAPYPELLTVTLEHAHEHSTGRLEFARARLRRDAHGRLLVRLHSLQGSGSLPSMADVDALVLLPSDRERFAAGDTLHALPLHHDRCQPEPPYP